MENEKKKGLCGICPDKCWIEATIENGKLVKVEPDKDCQKKLYIQKTEFCIQWSV